MRPTIRYT
ncbi:hypothetical protein F383_14981 [Gossypium arboreum]|uniref:Uncharacterized protein n=1 Tax=Gossypium arboreum TaxID=29729 RepID=A0A0B0MNR9_GOSAR|nr:hypothetical protein F383_39029 [Gossypium arboreum]KHG29961.1 hypothetical protein F383_14981 [Gossypium arboreum]